jgi:hypothetical protein
MHKPLLRKECKPRSEFNLRKSPAKTAQTVICKCWQVMSSNLPEFIVRRSRLWICYHLYNTPEIQETCTVLCTGQYYHTGP